MRYTFVKLEMLLPDHLLTPGNRESFLSTTWADMTLFGCVAL